MSDTLTDARWGDKALPDWRADDDDADPDDELLETTPADVVDMLGFDPLEFLDDEDDGIRADAWDEGAHPRVPSGQGGGGQFTSGGGGGGASMSSQAAETMPQPKTASLATYGPKHITNIQQLLWNGATKGESLDEVAKKLRLYAGSFGHNTVAKYASEVIAHLEKSSGLKPGALGKAISKKEFEANKGTQALPQAPASTAAPPPPAPEPKAPSPDAPKGPEPYAGSPAQMKIHEIATGNAPDKIAQIKAVMENPATSGAFTKGFGEQWINALGGEPASPAAAEPAKPIASAPLKAGVTRASENSSVWKRWTKLSATAAKPESAKTPQAKKIAPSLNGAWWNDKPAGVRDAVKGYTDGTYGMINQALRGQGSNPQAATLINAIDDLFEEDGARLTEDVMLHRGEAVPADVIEKLEAALKTGLPCRYFKDGFISTSMAHSAAFGGKPVQFEIVARKGTPALGLAPVSPHSENEVLMRHGQTFDVVEIDRSGNQTRVKMIAIL